MILDLARQGLTFSANARRTGHDRKTIRKYVERGLEPPAYTPRPPAPSPLAPFEAFQRERIGSFPDLTGRRLWREVRELGFPGGYSTVTDFLRTVRPASEPAAFERRFGTPPGRQAQVDFAYFIVVRIEGASYRLRRHADLLPDSAGPRPLHQPDAAPRHRGRLPKSRPPELNGAA